ILQNEVPDAVNVAAARAAKKTGALVCLNAAPARDLSEDLAALVDVLVVNAIEAEAFGADAIEDLAGAADAARQLSPRYPVVVVTAGGDGVAGLERGGIVVSLPALPVTLVSTHGAGDVFVGALVAALVGGQGDLADHLRTANAAAAAHVSRPAAG
ncbi:MAG: ribokinase, partial [Sphingomonas sp.]